MSADPAQEDRFDKARTSRIAAAASLIGIAPGATPDDRQLAHLAWHVAAIEPSELRQLSGMSCSRRSSSCPNDHAASPDPLDEILPLPHPLDYDWRYDPPTRRLLAGRCERLAGPFGPIVLLGTPTLAPDLQGHRGDVLLLDVNSALLTALSSSGTIAKVQCAAADLAQLTPPPGWRHRASVVVCDPPWYPDGLATFLRAASQLVRPGGRILMSVPDLLTRPSISHELKDLRDLAGQLRLALVATSPRTLRYRTPFFEFRAMRAAGLRIVPLNWRAGTLWQFISTGIAPGAAYDRCQPSAGRDSFTEASVSLVRIRVICSCCTTPGVLSLRAVVPGDTLPTVSRRHPARTLASLWTTGNSVLACADPELTGLFLRQLPSVREGSLERTGDQLARNFADWHHLPIRDVIMASDKIGSIVARELTDYTKYLMASRYCNDTPARSLRRERRLTQ